MRILCISGSGRSGSTILHNLLGQLEGFTAVGEVRFVWDRGFIKNSSCGCGTRFRKCAFWNAVVSTAFGGMDRVNAEEMWRLFEDFPVYQFPWVVFPSVQSKLVSRLKKYLDNLEKLYGAIETTSTARVIVDTSKQPHYAYLLQMLPGVQLFCIHLVRDSRAVAYSWQRQKLFEPQCTSLEYMAKQGPFNSSLQWLARNLGAHFLFRKEGVKHMPLRYEDFVRRPRASIEDILAFLGEECGDLTFTSDCGAVISQACHSVFGNLVRFQTGEVSLKIDDAWEKKMKWIDKFIVTSLTWPLLSKYGYMQS
jgi:hypothetical protein